MTLNMIFRLILGFFIYMSMLALQFIIMGIARFFERTSGQRTRYQFYLASILLTTISAIIYLLRIPDTTNHWPDFVGAPLANILAFIAGLILIILSNALHEKMMGGQHNERR